MLYSVDITKFMCVIQHIPDVLSAVAIDIFGQLALKYPRLMIDGRANN